MVNNTKQSSASFQKENVTINSMVANVPWCIGKNGEGSMHAVYASAKFTQRKPKPAFHLSCHHNQICPYLHSLNVRIHFGINIENCKHSTFLPLSRLKILNPKGRRDLPGFCISSEHFPMNGGAQITFRKI